MLLDRLRPLTLRNKRTVEWFDWHYRELKKINGEAGFNYPGIHQYFSSLALRAMDGAKNDKSPYDDAQEFIKQAKGYAPIIHGVHLFRQTAG